MRGMDADSVDSIVTDPPYGLAFMGKKWDYDVPSVAIWAECLRVLKPGGHLLAFAGTRTQHRMAVRIEDAGFEIRDMIAWVYGSGFPKSLDVSKAIDKAAGAEREREEPQTRANESNSIHASGFGKDGWAPQVKTAITDDARRWAGWGTALKPAMEPITVARKPLAGTVAANVLEFGTGAINVDGCRVAAEPDLAKNWNRTQSKNQGIASEGLGAIDLRGYAPSGRWPANLIHDGSVEAVAGFPESAQSSARPNSRGVVYDKDGAKVYGKYAPNGHNSMHDDTGSAARFFYCAKANGKDRGDDNNHPTVKPTDLMRYLCRLVTPSGGVVLDPFMGSGSTGKAAMLEGFRFVGIEREEQYAKIAEERIAAAGGLFT